MFVSAKRPNESDNGAFKQAAGQDMPQGFTGKPFVYEPIRVQMEIVSLLPFISALMIGIIAIQLKFNEVDVYHMIRQPLYVIIPAILVLPLHELVHGGACYLMTRPHRCPEFRIKWKRIFFFMYTFLPPGAFLTKRQTVIGLLMPLSLAVLAMLAFLFVSSYEWAISLFIFFWISAGAGYNDLDQVIMLPSFPDNVSIAIRDGYNVIY